MRNEEKVEEKIKNSRNIQQNSVNTEYFSSPNNQKKLGARSPKAALCELRSRAVEQLMGHGVADQSLRDSTVPSTHASRDVEIASI